MSADMRLTAAREYLNHIRTGPKPSALPRIRIDREDAELRRQLGQVLDVASESAAVAGLLCDAVAAVVYELDTAEAALVLDALEVAAEYRRYRADVGCEACRAEYGGMCESCAADDVRAMEYDGLAAKIREAGL